MRDRLVRLLWIGLLVLVAVSLVGVSEAEASASQSAKSIYSSQLRDFLSGGPSQNVMSPLGFSTLALENVQIYEDGYDSPGLLDIDYLGVGFERSSNALLFGYFFYYPFAGIYGNDALVLQIDSDSNASTGYPWPSDGIGADYMVEVYREGVNLSALLIRTPSTNNATWATVGLLDGTHDLATMAVSYLLPLPSIGNPARIRVMAWSYYADYYIDSIPNAGYVTYVVPAAPTTTTLPPSTTTTVQPTTTTTLPPTSTTTLPTTTTTTMQSTTTTTISTPQAFPDVPSWHPYATQINDLAARGIVLGYTDGTFGPDSWVKRQQFAKMIVLSLNLPVSESDVSPFGDVDVSGPSGFYPDNYVAVCAARGITLGTAPGLFSPWNEISRAQLITMAARAANLPDPPAGYTPPFGNFSVTHYPWARKAASAGLLNGLQGVGPAYDFWGPATRGEVAAILYNLMRR